MKIRKKKYKGLERRRRRRRKIKKKMMKEGMHANKVLPVGGVLAQPHGYPPHFLTSRISSHHTRAVQSPTERKNLLKNELRSRAYTGPMWAGYKATIRSPGFLALRLPATTTPVGVGVYVI